MKPIKNSQPFFTDEDIIYFQQHSKKILESGELILGRYTNKFELQLETYLSCQKVVAVSSATAALEIIFKYYQLEGKEIIIPNNTFLSTLYAIQNVKAFPVISDINLDDFNIDVNDFLSKITKKTAAVVITHIAGKISENIFEIKKICEDKNILLIEDASHAFGSMIQKNKVGNFGNATVVSLYPTKNITTGTGGLIITNDLGLGDFARIYKNHGFHNGENHVIAPNMHMNEFSALLGIIQLRNLDLIIEKRNSIFNLYQEKLGKIFKENNIYFQKQHNQSINSFYKIIIYSPNKEIMNILKNYLQENGVDIGGCYFNQITSHLTTKSIVENKNLTMSHKFQNNHLTLPCHLNLKENEQEYIIEKVNQVLGE